MSRRTSGILLTLRRNTPYVDYDENALRNEMKEQRSGSDSYASANSDLDDFDVIDDSDVLYGIQEIDESRRSIIIHGVPPISTLDMEMSNMTDNFKD